ITSVIRGKGKLKDVLLGLATEFTDTLVHNFVDTMMQNVTGKEGILGQIFNSMGQQSAGGTGGLPGGILGATTPATPGQASPATGGALGFVGKAFKGIG